MGATKTSFLSSFFEREKNCLQAQHIIFPATFFAVGLGGRGVDVFFIQKSISVCFFSAWPITPAEIQVYNVKMGALLVLLVGNCYEITVISPFSNSTWNSILIQFSTFLGAGNRSTLSVSDTTGLQENQKGGGIGQAPP